MFEIRHEIEFYGVFTLPDIETDTDTDKKWVIKNCVEVFTLHRHNNAIEYCYNLLGLVSLSVSVSGSVNTPLVPYFWPIIPSLFCLSFQSNNKMYFSLQIGVCENIARWAK